MKPNQKDQGKPAVMYKSIEDGLNNGSLKVEPKF